MQGLENFPLFIPLINQIAASCPKLYELRSVHVFTEQFSPPNLPTRLTCTFYGEKFLPIKFTDTFHG